MSRQLHALLKQCKKRCHVEMVSILNGWSYVCTCDFHMLQRWADSNAHVFNNLLPSFDGDLLTIAKLKS